SPVPRHHFSRSSRRRVIISVGVETTGRHGRNRVHFINQQLPERLGIVDITRKPAADSDNSNRLVHHLISSPLNQHQVRNSTTSGEHLSLVWARQRLLQNRWQDTNPLNSIP